MAPFSETVVVAIHVIRTVENITIPLCGNAKLLLGFGSPPNKILMCSDHGWGAIFIIQEPYTWKWKGILATDKKSKSMVWAFYNNFVLCITWASHDTRDKSPFFFGWSFRLMCLCCRLHPSIWYIIGPPPLKTSYSGNYLQIGKWFWHFLSSHEFVYVKDQPNPFYYLGSTSDENGLGSGQVHCEGGLKPELIMGYLQWTLVHFFVRKRVENELTFFFLFSIERNTNFLWEK